MKTELILTIEDKVIASAKVYCLRKGKSLSHLVENYLKSISTNTKEDSQEVISPKVLKLMGVIKLPDNFDYKSEVRNWLLKKYTK